MAPASPIASVPTGMPAALSVRTAASLAAGDEVRGDRAVRAGGGVAVERRFGVGDEDVEELEVDPGGRGERGSERGTSE